MSQVDERMMLTKIKKMGYKGLMENLELFIVDLMVKNEKLQEKIDGYNKDAEIQKLKKELERVRRNSLHVLSEDESIEVKDFRSEHFSLCKGNTSYILSGTGIGTVLELQCDKCGVTKDITDYSKW